MNRHILILYGIIATLVTLIVILKLQENFQSQNETQNKHPNQEQQSNSLSKDQNCPINQFVIAINSKGEIACSAIQQNSQSSRESASERKLNCFNHGFIENGFCTCDEGWTGPECQYPESELNENAPPDNDKDNVSPPLDCDDNNDLVYPGAPDSVDGIDNDCDGIVDEGY